MLLMGGWIKHFCWCSNVWLDVCVKFFYIDSASKLNFEMFHYKIIRTLTPIYTNLGQVQVSSYTINPILLSTLMLLLKLVAS